MGTPWSVLTVICVRCAMNDRESIHNGIAHEIHDQRAGCCCLLLAWLGYGFTWAYGVTSILHKQSTVQRSVTQPTLCVLLGAASQRGPDQSWQRDVVRAISQTESCAMQRAESAATIRFRVQQNLLTK